MSGSKQLRCIATGQLSHGNRLLSCTVRPPNQGKSKPFSRMCKGQSTEAARHRGSADPGSTLGRSEQPLCFPTDLQLQ